MTQVSKFANKRTDEQKDRDLAFIASLYVRGYNLSQIHMELNNLIASLNEGYTLSPQMIGYEVRRLHEQWKKQSFETIEEHIRRDLAKLDAMEIELWQAWRDSKGKRIRVRFKGMYIEHDNSNTQRCDTETMNGDPRYMDLLLRVRSERAKLLGYDKPDLVVLVDKTEDKRDKLVQALGQDLIKEIGNSLLGIETKVN